MLTLAAIIARKLAIIGFAGVPVHLLLVGLAVILSLTSGYARAADVNQDTIVVTLLGTGTPWLNPRRFGPSTLVQAAGLNLVFDAGRGSSIRLGQVGVPLGRISALFITHLHSDHVNGFSDLWMAGYMGNPSGSREVPLQVYGPRGIKHLADNVMVAFQADTALRGRGGRIPRDAEKIESHEINSEGVIFDEAGVRVTAFRVTHVDRSYGYRVDYGGKAVLVSGDTSFNQNLIDHGEGVDLLIHEVRMRPPGADYGIHTSPEDAGRVFAATGTRMAVYSHIILAGRDSTDPAELAELVARTRETYSGPLTVGEDLLRFIVGDQVTVDSSYVGRGISARARPPRGRGRRRACRSGQCSMKALDWAQAASRQSEAQS